MSSIDGLTLSSELSRCLVPASVVLFDGSVLPASADLSLRQALNDAFEKKWNANAAQFARTLEEISGKFEEAQLEIATQKEEHNRYKSRAQTILAQQQTELSAVTSSLESARAVEGELDQAKAKLAELERAKSDYDPHRFASLESELLDARADLSSQRQSQQEVISRFNGQIAALEAKLTAAYREAEEATQNKENEHDQAIKAIREELEKHRAKARELVTQKEAQIHMLQNKLKLGGSTNALTQLARDEQPNASVVASPLPVSAPSASPAASVAAAASAVSFDPSTLPGSGSAPPASSLAAGEYELGALLASRDEELHRCRTHIRQLQDQLRTAEINAGSNRDHEAELTRRIAELERAAKRNQEFAKQENIEYLKNVIIKYLETGDEVTTQHNTTTMRCDAMTPTNPQPTHASSSAHPLPCRVLSLVSPPLC